MPKQLLFNEIAPQASRGGRKGVRERRVAFEQRTDPAIQNRNETFHATRERHPRLREMVLAFIKRRYTNGATRDEVAQALGIAVATVCGRCNELKKMGEIVETDERRLTRSGKTGVVMVARSA